MHGRCDVAVPGWEVFRVGVFGSMGAGDIAVAGSISSKLRGTRARTEELRSHGTKEAQGAIKCPVKPLVGAMAS